MKKKSGFEDFGMNMLDDRFECGVGALAFSAACEELFLNAFTHEEVTRMLRESGALAPLMKRFPDLLVDFSRDSSMVHGLSIFAGHAEPDRRLVHVKLTDEQLQVPGRAFSVLRLEWIATRDLNGSFTKKRPQLPGQAWPGLGILDELLEFTFAAARGLSREGVVAVADHFHNAVFYSKRVRYVDPAAEALLQAAQRDLRKCSLADISWGFITGTVLDRGEPVSFKASEQAHPLSDSMAGLYGHDWRKAFTERSRSMKLSLDLEKMKSLREERLRVKPIAMW